MSALSSRLNNMDFIALSATVVKSKRLSESTELRRYRKALEDYRKFKQLRKEIGKPVKETIESDLFISDSGLQELKSRERRNNSVRRRTK